MKYKLFTILILLILMILPAVPLQAEDCLVTAAINSDKLVTISGKIGGYSGRTINIIVRDPNGDIDYIDTCLSGAGGLFHLSYTLSNTLTGRYTVSVGAAEIERPAVCYFLSGIQTDVKAEIDTKKLVTLTGITGVPGELISLRITDPRGNTEHLNGITSQDDGIFSLAYTMENKTKGVYKVSVNSQGSDTPATAEFVYGSGLIDLKMSHGVLDQGFDPETLSYTASVNSSIDSIQVTPTVLDPKSTVSINGSIVTSGTVSGTIPLYSGNNTITIIVTERDKTLTTYVITVSREAPYYPPPPPPPPPILSSNAALSELLLNDAVLDQSFSPEALGYTSTVPNSTTSVTVTPTAADSRSTVRVNGEIVPRGQASQAIPLYEGSNTITLVVSAEAGNTKTYTITVTRIIALYSVLIADEITGGTVTADIEGRVEAGTIVNLTVMPDSGWQLKANTLIYNDGTDHLIEGTSFIMPQADVTVTAEFERLYSVTVDDEMTGGTLSTDVTTAAAASIITLTVAPEDGWRMVPGSLQYTDGTVYYPIYGDPPKFAMLNADVTVTAQFERIPTIENLTITVGFRNPETVYTLYLEEIPDMPRVYESYFDQHWSISGYPWFTVTVEEDDSVESVEIIVSAGQDTYTFVNGEEQQIINLSASYINPIYFKITVYGEGDLFTIYQVFLMYDY